MYADDPIHACLPFCKSFLCSSFKICILIIALRGKGQQNWYMSLVYPLLVVHCIVHVYANYIPLPTIKIGENSSVWKIFVVYCV